MATTKANNIILEVARRLKSARTSAGPDGDGANIKYSSAILTGYLNRAIRDLLTDTYGKLGDSFGDAIPEYVRTSGVLTLAGGVVAKPADAWHVTDLVDSARTILGGFSKPPRNRIETIRTSTEPLVIPTEKTPIFWEEGSNIYTLGLLDAEVIATYIKTHQDLVVITAAQGDGYVYNIAANILYTYATRTLRINTVANPPFTWVAADANKEIIFFLPDPVVFSGRIESVTVGAGYIDIVVMGDGLPTADIGAGRIVAIVTPDIGPDSSDITLNDNLFGTIVDKMIAFGIADAKNGVV